MPAIKKRKMSAPNEEETTVAVKAEPIATRSASRKSAASAGTKGVHPLLIDHILETVFEHLFWPNSKYPNVEGTYVSIQDVRNSRLVCKQWNEAATKLYRRGRSPSMFGNVMPPHSSLKTYDLNMQSFLDVMKTSSLIPVQRYVIGANFFVKQNQRLMKDFMRICGPSATELRFYFDYTSTMNFTRRSFPDLKLPKLKSLLFNCGNYRGRNCSSQTYEIPYLVEVVLGAAERLQEFRFEFAPRDFKWQSVVVRRFAEIISKRIPKSVKILRLDMWLNDNHLNTLADTGLELQEFQFDCHCAVGKDVIKKFFERQSRTLRVLKILNSDPNCSVSVDFPRFDQLRQMELQGATISPFSYPDTFPKLETLNLSEWKTEKTVTQLLQLSKKANSLREIFFPSRFSQAGLVRKAAQCFPNIKSVHIAPSPDIAEALQEAFVYLPDIEELYVSFPFLLDNELNVDSLFSGVSELDCRRILKHRNFENVNVRDVQKKPSITNLKKLKKLVIDDSASDIILTDFSAHFSFMKMDNLKELQTSRFRMSSKYVDLLRNKLALKLTEDDYSDYSSDDSIDSDGWNSDSSGEELEIIPFLGFGFNVFFIH
ncbi:hypothetical protein Ocin01_08303 [Orchesella cincta]|uniref:F-box domain-containing protein n=1 Tax=Orchesella cincta TaxID=48709 RepID=A0A1D2MZA4_ORCCI|nr:hypothetical protein Ocin01_08303 [Orchesella cincta]